MYGVCMCVCVCSYVYCRLLWLNPVVELCSLHFPPSLSPFLPFPSLSLSPSLPRCFSYCTTVSTALDLALVACLLLPTRLLQCLQVCLYTCSCVGSSPAVLCLFCDLNLQLDVMLCKLYWILWRIHNPGELLRSDFRIA